MRTRKLLILLETTSRRLYENNQLSINSRRIVSLPHEIRDVPKSGLVGIPLARILEHGANDMDEVYEHLMRNDDGLHGSCI